MSHSFCLLEGYLALARMRNIPASCRSERNKVQRNKNMRWHIIYSNVGAMSIEYMTESGRRNEHDVFSTSAMRAVPVKDQCLPVRGASTHGRGTQQGTGAGYRACDQSRHQGLVQTLRLLTRTQVVLARATSARGGSHAWCFSIYLIASEISDGNFEVSTGSLDRGPKSNLIKI